MSQPTTVDTAGALELARALVNTRRRTLLAIAGPPGAGKSTLASRLTAELGDACVVVPMDGFHLADVALDRLGLRGRKGAPETFDAYGYAALLVRLAGQQDPVVYAPAFDRELEQPVAGSIAVHRDVPLVVTEGNYLLLPDEAWRRARSCVEQTWYCELAPEVRHERLVRRHVQFGKAPDAAVAWVRSVDGPNAELVQAGRGSADVLVHTD